MEGIGDIAEYNPNSGRVQVLYDARSGNSGTLENRVEDRQKELKEIPENNTKKRKIVQEKLDEALKSAAGLRAAGESARIHSAELMNKKSVSFGDLYHVISDLSCEEGRKSNRRGSESAFCGKSQGKIC